MKTISAQELKNLKENESPFLVDVRTGPERLEGRLEDHLWISMDEIMDRAGEIPKDQPVYVYCRSGNRSGQVVAHLATQGFENLINVAGGIIEYEQVGGIIVRGSLEDSE